jgi:hypothetical protein
MNQSIIILNQYKWHIPYYFPKPSKLSTNAQTFVYTNPYIKITETPTDIKTNYKRLKQKKPTPTKHITHFDGLEKENIPPPPPPLGMLRRSYASRSLLSLHRW